MGRAVTARQALVGAALVAVLSVGASTAIAGELLFTDVPEEHPFHDEIAAVAQAGITTGYPDDTYRPSDPVTRQAMAAFLGRGLSSVSVAVRDASVPLSIVGEIDGPGVEAELMSTEVTAGAAGAGTGYVVVDGLVVVVDGQGACPCRVLAQVFDDGDPAPVPSHLAITASPRTTTGPVSGVFPIAAETTSTITVQVRVLATTAVEDIEVWGTMTATYVPFLGDENVETPPPPG